MNIETKKCEFHLLITDCFYRTILVASKKDYDMAKFAMQSDVLDMLIFQGNESKYPDTSLMMTWTI